MFEDWFEKVLQQAVAENRFADLIESAFLAGIIDEEAQELAYLWLANNYQRIN